MLSEVGIRTIAEALIGDIRGFYSYKSGGKIVEFFNSNFGFSDVYGQGFPSRWLYTVENIKVLWNNNRFDEFLNLILSKRFIMRDYGLNEVQALEKVEEIVSYLNEELNIEGYKIHKQGQAYFLISEDGDLEFIGGGGFANVYESRSTGLIVKKLKDDFKIISGIRHRFKREFEITKGLDDLNGIIKVYELDDSNYSYTMEKAESTFEDFMNDYEHDEDTKLIMIRQLLHIMKAVHERNIIHRDISPNNVLLFNGQLKISDFGLGKDLDMFYSHRTMRTQSIGQYHYCAPEQFMQLKEGDKRSDVYSLGSLINFIMTGDPRDSRHFMRNPVEKAKNENPNMRYADAGSLLEGIERSIQYHKNQELKELVTLKIHNGIYDDDVENYIYSLNGVDLCKEIITASNMVSAVLRFIESNERRAVEILQLLNENYLDVCIEWEDYDNFGTIAYNVIHDNNTYVAQEISARILYDVAYNKDRFNMKRLVDNLIDIGIDPTIEDILKQ
ncbi:Protein kinase domain-containing protein [Clostridium cavendishii DSM 21758]|uniref:Protein kinase domain-containing protein n=1 Tax=Clostridium cavendishii DSM 21758 TaxID=1121302 RepID=A0A1M6GLP8_9CLOT|nr:protein kinase [Clostridium cavendishii]SHJ10851.1 Protein kinase domain-containing protein [Clostridium cavendishii DSM 21758]